MHGLFDQSDTHMVLFLGVSDDVKTTIEKTFYNTLLAFFMAYSVYKGKLNCATILPKMWRPKCKQNSATFSLVSKTDSYKCKCGCDSFHVSPDVQRGALYKLRAPLWGFLNIATIITTRAPYLLTVGHALPVNERTRGSTSVRSCRFIVAYTSILQR